MADLIPGLLPATHDTGCKMAWPLLAGIVGAADFRGENREHRLTLVRHKGDAAAPFALWIGMNPSAAEADVDDLTVRKEQTWTWRMDLGRYVKVNVGTYRWTNSRTLGDQSKDLIHPENFPLIRKIAAQASYVMVATGEPPSSLAVAAAELIVALEQDGVKMLCLGETKSGWPKHSSRIRYNQPLVRFMPFRLYVPPQ